MTGRGYFAVGLGLAVVALAVVLSMRGGESEPGISTTTSTNTATTGAVEPQSEGDTVPATTTAPDVTVATGDGCQPLPGTEVSAAGEIDGYPSGETIDGRIIMGSSVSTWFRIDGPVHRNLFLLRLIYVDGNNLHGWSDTGSYEGTAISYDPGNQRMTGTFDLSHTVDPEGSELADPEPADVDMVYDAAAGTVTGTVTHPDETFTFELAAEELERDFFEDSACYPTPTDVGG